jgi:glycosyltransferase involved in cell wall biosynthesis/O-antigen/teichoic acid export membrane protein
MFGAVVLVVALLVSGVGSLVFHVIVSRGLGPRGYGATSALLGALLAATLPLGALQLLVTRAVVSGGDARELSGRSLVRRASVAAVAVAAGVCVASPLISSYLHLRSRAAVGVAGAVLVPDAVVLVLRGLLLGRRRYGVVAAADVVGTAAKVGLAALLVEVCDVGVVGAVLAVLAGDVLTGLLLLGLSRRLVCGPGERVTVRFRDGAGATATLAGFWVLASADLVLARHYLAPAAAGGYAAAALLARVGLAVPAAVTTAASPLFAQHDQRAARRALTVAAAAVSVVGVAMIAAATAVGPLVIGAAMGPGYVPGRMILAVLMSTSCLLGVTNLLLTHRISRGAPFVAAPWLGLAVLVVAVAVWHSTPLAIAVDAALAAAVSASLVAVAARRRPQSAPSGWVAPSLPLWDDRAGSVDVTVVVPFFNPGEHLRRNLFQLIEVLQSLSLTFEIITVADGCTDGSEMTIADVDPRLVRRVSVPVNAGKGAALRCGMALSRGRYVGFIDADGDLDPVLWRPFIELMRLYEPDMIIGSKRHPLSQVDYPPLRRVYSFGFQRLTRLLFRVPVRDTQTGIKLIRRDVLAEVLPRLMEPRFAFDLELLAVSARLGYRRVFEAPVTLRHQFHSTVSARAVGNMLVATFAIAWRLTVVRRYDRCPPRFALHPDATYSAVGPSRRAGPRGARILVCNWRDIAHPRAGGAEVYTHEVLQRWAAQGHAVTLFAGAVTGRAATEEMNGVKVVRGGSRFGVYRRARRYAERRQGGFDVIVDEINTRPFGSPAWAGATPVVALMHQVAAEVWPEETVWPVALLGRYVLEPWWLRRYRDIPVMTISVSSQMSLCAMGLQKVTVVPPGVSLPAELPVLIKEQAPTLLFVGRLAANKRPDHALEAHRLVREQFPDAQLWVVGTGPVEAALRAEAPAGVTFFGRVEEHEKFDLMARAHLLVVTSTREGWGLVVDEAAAVATATVAYDVAGLRDSVPAAGGTLVAPAPEALAAQIVALLPAVLTNSAYPSRGWAGGASSWDVVAEALLSVALDAAGVASSIGPVPDETVVPLGPVTNLSRYAEQPA